MDVPMCVLPAAFPQPQCNDCTQCHDRSHKLQQIDICVSDVSVIANILEEVWGIKRVPSLIGDIESHAITMLSACVHEDDIVSYCCLSVHPLDSILARLIAQKQWDCYGDYKPTSVIKT